MSDLRQAAQMAREALLEIDLLTSAVGDDEYLNDLVQKPLAALTSALEAREWRTMESAPRDQRILLYAPGDPYSLPDLISVCEWHPDAGFCICELREPTHWRPLPPPPQGEK